MTHPALVVFDLAGTTVEDPGAVNRCLREALAAAGVRPSEAEVDAVMGIPKPQAIRILVERAGRLAEIESALASVYDDFAARMERYYREDPGVREVPGSGDVFRALHAAGARVAVDTGFSRPITQIVLERMGWKRLGLIDASVTSDEVPRGRPAPDMVHYLMQRLGVTDPARVAKVGDAPADLEEGTNAGCGWVIGVTDGTHTRAQLAPFPHTHLIANVRDLIDLFGLAPRATVGV
jgi:phosphonatase-like hydrolase